MRLWNVVKTVMAFATMSLAASPVAAQQYATKDYYTPETAPILASEVEPPVASETIADALPARMTVFETKTSIPEDAALTNPSFVLAPGGCSIGDRITLTDGDNTLTARSVVAIIQKVPEVPLPPEAPGFMENEVPDTSADAGITSPSGIFFPVHKQSGLQVAAYINPVPQNFDMGVVVNARFLGDVRTPSRLDPNWVADAPTIRNCARAAGQYREGVRPSIVRNLSQQQIYVGKQEK